jgi:hypothetical protein
MKIIEKHKDYRRKFVFDCGFQRLVLALKADEFATYSLNNIKEGAKVNISFHTLEEVVFEVLQDGERLHLAEISGEGEFRMTEMINLKKKERTAITLKVIKGSMELESIITYAN